jgi:histone-lysine N-methyltransferase SETD1
LHSFTAPQSSSSSSSSSALLSHGGQSGCSRADEVVPVGLAEEDPVTGERRTVLRRILTKLADGPTTTPSKGEERERGREREEEERDEDEDEEEASQRDNEYNRLRFLEMSLAYLRDPSSKLEVRKSGIHGWGLFARINFEKNDVVVEYIGQKIRQVVADQREAQYEELGVGSCYLFRLDKDDIIDATKVGGMARFINHCCEPNAYAKIISIEESSLKSFRGYGIGKDWDDLGDAGGFIHAGKHITIMAARDIQEGEEITYDYKFPIEDKKLRCFCGARSCQGSMN